MKKNLVTRDTTATYWIQSCLYEKTPCVSNWTLILT